MVKLGIVGFTVGFDDLRIFFPAEMIQILNKK